MRRPLKIATQIVAVDFPAVWILITDSQRDNIKVTRKLQWNRKYQSVFLKIHQITTTPNKYVGFWSMNNSWSEIPRNAMYYIASELQKQGVVNGEDIMTFYAVL